MRHWVKSLILVLPVCLPAQTPPLYINEFLTSNTAINIEPEYKEFADWVEIYNGGTETIDLGGYYLTDNFDTPTEWRIPYGNFIEPGGVRLIWTDGSGNGAHTNFKLSKYGDEIVLFDAEGNLVDGVAFDRQVPDQSKGRQPDGSANWVYFGEPTPGELNGDAGLSTKLPGPAPLFDLPGGFYSGSLILTLSPQLDSTQIRYTMDGTRPTSASLLYESTIPISYTKVIRARAYHPRFQPSEIITQTYFIDDQPTLPVFSIATDPDYLWDEDIGIAVNGGDCNDPSMANSCQGWERPAHVEFYEADGSLGLSVNTGLRVRGSQTCIFPRKQFGFFARDKYGADMLEYPFFPEKFIAEFKRLVLRPGGADGLGNVYRGSMFRDGLIANLVRDVMDIDHVGYRPSIVYLNGEYFGIHNIHERIKQYYLEANYGVDKDELDILENPYNGGVYQGDDTHYRDMLDFVASHDLSLYENYEHFCTLVDVEEYMNYQITQLYIVNYEWGQLNIECWRPKTGDGRWRWVLWDLEGGFNSYPNGYNDYTVNAFNYIEDDLLRHRWLFEQLLQVPRFRNDFIQRFALHLGTTFEAGRVEAMIDSLQAILAPEMPRDIDRWGGECQDGCGVIQSYCTIPSVQAWEDNVDYMRDFARGRPSYVRRHIISKFNLTGSARMIFDFQDARGGDIVANGVRITDSTSIIVFKNVPLELVAVPAVGYQFAGWEDLGTADTLQFILTGDSSVTAVFEPVSTTLVPTSLETDLILHKADNPHYAVGDIHVASGATLTLEAGTELYMPQGANIIVNGGFNCQGTEAEPVIIQPNHSYGATDWGCLFIDSASSTAQLSHVQLLDGSHAEDPVFTKAALSVKQSEILLEDVLVEATGLPVYAWSSHVTMLHSSLESDIEVGDLINVRRGYAHIEGCVFRNAPSACDLDAIDLDELDSAWVGRNQLFGIHGDAIDLGEAAMNVTVFGNEIFDSDDKGVSIGEGSHAFVERNLIVGCLEGIAVKDNSYAVLNCNTYYRNQTAIATYEKTLNLGGATAIILNSIISNSVVQDCRTDALSTSVIAYSLSDREDLTGDFNLRAYPQFVDPWSQDFNLQSSSPAIDAGFALYQWADAIVLDMADSEYEGQAPDMGAYEFGMVVTEPLALNLPSEFKLYENYPNPFNPSTTIRFNLPADAKIQLLIYDVKGRMIRILDQGMRSAGQYSVVWNGSNKQGELVSTGLYFCRLLTPEFIETQKMLLLR